MVNARRPNPSDPRHTSGNDPEQPALPRGGRFNVLLTEDRQRPDEHWTRQLPRLMEPLGVHAHLAGTGQEAVYAAERLTFHAAVIDLATPVGKPVGGAGDPETGGLWLLQVIRRLPGTPPVVVVNSRATQRQGVRLLNEALRLGAFSVVNQPANLNAVLGVIQRLLNRHHQGQWPTPPAPTSGSDASKL